MKWRHKSASLLLAIAAFTTAGAALGDDKRSEARIVWSLDHQGLGKFCYDRIPEVIFFEYDVPTRTTSIRSESLAGYGKIIGSFPGSPDERSLSCSDDGTTIAALDGEKKHLYIIKSGVSSAYAFDSGLIYSVNGLYSLLSGNGKIISVPGRPKRVAGPDIIKEFKLFISDYTERIFIVGDTVYVNKENEIFVNEYIDKKWMERKVMTLPSGFGLSEISECGQHIVGSASNDEIVKYFTFERPVRDGDWLNKIGFYKLSRPFGDQEEITGGYRHCAFPLIRRRDIRHVVEGLATIDDGGINVFSISGSKVAMSGNEIRLSKDGCHALLNLFQQVADIPQFTMPQKLAVIKLGSKTCGF